MYEDYYAKQSGGEMPVFMGGRQQRGHGIGNFFARVKRFAIPLLKRGAQVLLPRLFKTGTEIMSDVSQGQKVKDAFKSRVPGAIKDAASDFFRQSGSGLRTRNVKRKKAVRHAPLKRLKL
jgi:hypothetical protein